MFVITMHIDKKLIKTLKYKDREEAQSAFEYFSSYSRNSEYVKYELSEV